MQINFQQFIPRFFGTVLQNWNSVLCRWSSSSVTDCIIQGCSHWIGVDNGRTDGQPFKMQSRESGWEKSFCDFQIGIIEMCRKCIFVGKLPFSHPHKCGLTVVGSFRISIVYFIYIYIIFRHQHHHCGCNLDDFYFGLPLFVVNTFLIL